MRTCIDSSAFAKGFIEEEGSAKIESICARATELGLSVLCVPEIVSALSRRRREGSLTPAQYRKRRQSHIFTYKNGFGVGRILRPNRVGRLQLFVLSAHSRLNLGSPRQGDPTPFFRFAD